MLSLFNFPLVDLLLADFHLSCSSPEARRWCRMFSDLDKTSLSEKCQVELGRLRLQAWACRLASGIRSPKGGGERMPLPGILLG